MRFNYRKLFEPDKQRFGISRIEALSDGVFSITMTLLILDIRLPHIPGGIDPNIGELLTLLPKLENYFISFIVLGLFWVRQQMQFKVIKEADRNLLWINILFLMFIALTPLSTSLLFEYDETPISIQIYCVIVVILSIILHYQWHYSIKNYRLVDESYDMAGLKKIRLINMLFPVLFTVTFFLSMVNMRLAKTSLYALPVLSGVLFKVYKRVRGKNDGKDLI
jgi:uncharacterized membrane protein